MLKSKSISLLTSLFWNKLRCIRDNLDCHFANVQCCVFKNIFHTDHLVWGKKVSESQFYTKLKLLHIWFWNVHIQLHNLCKLNAQLPKLLMRTACLIRFHMENISLPAQYFQSKKFIKVFLSSFYFRPPKECYGIPLKINV